MNIDKEKTLGEIVSAYPDTVKVMNCYKMDYCCNGKDTLGVALDRLETDSEKILEELEESITLQKPKEVKDWKSGSMASVIDYILDKHHTFMKETFDELNLLVIKILKVHYKDHSEQLLQVHKLVGNLKTELEAHLVKEEEYLFPMIKEFELTRNEDTKAKIIEFIETIEGEHDVAGDLFKELEIVTNDFNPPEGACTTYKRTFKLLDEIEKDTFNHIHMENSVLFTMI